MKSLSVVLLTALLAVSACNKNDNDDNPLPTPGTGEVTAVGVPDGDYQSGATIGAAGGTIVSPDDELTVTIPAGALTSNQEIRITRITNTNPMGIKNGYRITPHNLQFAKPVTITFNYTDEDIAGSVPEALGIAYQDAAGVWQSMPDVTLNKTAQTVSVTTTHFSDWSFFESFEIQASSRFIGPGESAQLEVISHANVVGPLTGEQPIGKRQSMTAQFIKGWSLSGAGTLTPNGAKASYKAPGKVPAAPNPVAVSAEIKLNRPGKFLVITHITIADDGEISVRVNGGDWVTQKATGATKFSDGYYAVADGDGDETGRYIFIRWRGETGTFGFKAPDALEGTHSHYQVNGGNTYTCSYISGERLVTSGGGVTITSMGEKGTFIEGTVDINPAGYGPMLLNTAHVEAKFKVRRHW